METPPLDPNWTPLTAQPSKDYYQRTVIRTVTIIEVYNGLNNNIDYVERSGKKLFELMVDKPTSTVKEPMRKMTIGEVALLSGSQVGGLFKEKSDD